MSTHVDAPSDVIAVSEAAAGSVLLVLGAAQFLMILDTSVMNVSIATVANDLGTTVTGIQTAITLFTLVMATLMITGGKIGTIIGRKRVFNIGLLIYASGSLTTALAPNLPVLLLGWSLLEGLGAALIMPAIVALVAGNVPAEGRTRAYGLIAAAAAIAVAVGPLIGGAATTYFSWRWVFAGEVLVAGAILLMGRRLADSPREPARLDLVGTLLTVVGLGSIVFAVLRASEWGLILPQPNGPQIAGLSPSVWLMGVGILVMSLFAAWEQRLSERGREPLVLPGTLANAQLSGGLTMFFFQYLLQGGYFFVVPLFLSVVLEMNALQTGARMVPLSLAVIAGAAGVPKVWPAASPRRVVRIGLALMLLGLVVLLGGLDLDANAAIVAVPMVLVGLGIGALASQLGAVTVSALPDARSGEAGGLQNTASNLGLSFGTALAGSMMIAILTTSLVEGIQHNPDVPSSVKSEASVQMATGVPFLSDAAATRALEDAGVDASSTEAIVAENRAARIAGLRAALAVLSLVALISLFFTGRIPNEQPGESQRGHADALSTTAAGDSA